MSAATMTQDKNYTVEEAAEYLRVHPSTVRRLIKRGKIRVFRIGRDIRIRQKALETFMEEAPKEEPPDTT
jgi:putative molybdopterin biosynthesis protein